MNNETIENYLNNGLTEAERTAFEQEMAADPNLAKTVALYREIEVTMANAHTAEAGIHTLQQQLEALGKQHFGQEKATDNETPVVAIKNKRRYFYWAGAAAAVVLAVVLVRPLLQTQQQVDLETLYSQNAQYDKLFASVTRSSESGKQPNPLLIEVQRLMSANTKKFDSALMILNKLPTTDTGYDIRLAKGVCYIETNDSARADEVFTEIQHLKDETYAVQATWYKAMLYLKYKDVATCRATLLSMPKDNDFADGRAILLKELPK